MGKLSQRSSEQEEILEDEYWDQAGWSLSQKRVGAEGRGCHILGEKSDGQATKVRTSQDEGPVSWLWWWLFVHGVGYSGDDGR